MARNANAALTKLALSIASVATLAGISGRFAAGEVAPRQDDLARLQQDPPNAAESKSYSDAQRPGAEEEETGESFFGEDDPWEGGEGSGGQTFTLVPPNTSTGTPAPPQLQAPSAGSPSQPSIRSHTRTRRS